MHSRHLCTIIFLLFVVSTSLLIFRFFNSNFILNFKFYCYFNLKFKMKLELKNLNISKDVETTNNKNIIVHRCLECIKSKNFNENIS
jgi:hypothetical protein